MCNLFFSTVAQDVARTFLKPLIQPLGHRVPETRHFLHFSLNESQHALFFRGRARLWVLTWITWSESGHDQQVPPSPSGCRALSGRHGLPAGCYWGPGNHLFFSFLKTNKQNHYGRLLRRFLQRFRGGKWNSTSALSVFNFSSKDTAALQISYYSQKTLSLDSLKRPLEIFKSHHPKLCTLTSMSKVCTILVLFKSAYFSKA